jgi:predicted nucleic-acid-binding protein
VVGLDTNVICRYLLGDDPAQARKAAQVIEDCRKRSIPCFLSKITLCEMVWVFETCTSMERSAIAGTLDALLHSDAIEVEERSSVRRALDLFTSGKADFADYLIGETDAERGCTKTVTFDTALEGTPGFEILRP